MTHYEIPKTERAEWDARPKPEPKPEKPSV